MGFNMQKLMKQAQKMQNDMARVQEELKNATVEGVSGGGMVKVTATAAGEVTTIQINPEIVDAEDVEMLEDMVLAALNEALSAGKALMEQEMGKITGGMNMPGMF